MALSFEGRRRESWDVCIELLRGFTAINFLGSVREDHIMYVFLVAHEISKGPWIQDYYFMLLHFAVMNSWFQIKVRSACTLSLSSHESLIMLLHVLSGVISNPSKILPRDNRCIVSFQRHSHPDTQGIITRFVNRSLYVSSLDEILLASL